MKKTLAIIKQPLRGVTFEVNAVIFDTTPTLEQLNTLAEGVAHVDGGTAWWLGDIGLAIQRAKVAEFLLLKGDKGGGSRILNAADRNAAAQRHAEQYTTTRAEVLGIDDGYFRNCIALVKFYPAAKRVDGLKVAHHIAAMMGSGGTGGDPDKARAWLGKAVAGEWTASELRRQINVSLATAPTPKHIAEKNSFALLDEADVWAARNPDDALPRDITPPMAAKLLVRWQALIAFVERLKSIAEKAA